MFRHFHIWFCSLIWLMSLSLHKRLVFPNFSSYPYEIRSINKLLYVGRRLSKFWEKKGTNYLTIITTSNIDPHKNYECCWINSYYAKNMFLNSMIFFTQSVKCCVCQIHRKVYRIYTAGVCQKLKICMFKWKWIIPALRSYYKCLLFFTKISVVVWKRLVAI